MNPRPAKIKAIEAKTERILSARRSTVRGIIVIGKELSEIQERKLWKNWREEVESFEDYIDSLAFSRATAYRCMAIWQKFGSLILRHSAFLDIDPSRLYQLLPIKNASEEWLYKAKELRAHEFEAELMELKGRPQENCEHEAITVCKKCHIRLDKKS